MNILDTLKKASKNDLAYKFIEFAKVVPSLTKEQRMSAEQSVTVIFESIRKVMPADDAEQLIEFCRDCASSICMLAERDATEIHQIVLLNVLVYVIQDSIANVAVQQ